MRDQSNDTSGSHGNSSPCRPPVNPRPRNRPGPQASTAAAKSHDAAGAASSRCADPAVPGDQRPSQPTSARKCRKGENGKWQPTGDYEVGFGRPPVATRFGGKPGPGRPKGSGSYDKLMAKHLRQRSRVRINGQETALSHAELIVMTTVKDAIQGKRRDARKQVLAEMARLMAPECCDRGVSPKDHNEADRLTLVEFYQNVRAQVLDEMGVDPAELTDNVGDEA